MVLLSFQSCPRDLARRPASPPHPVRLANYRVAGERRRSTFHRQNRRSHSYTAGATVRYSLTAGNADGKFALDTTTGQITIAAALDSATAASYTLTVEASDGSGETATATVTVTVAS